MAFEDDSAFLNARIAATEERIIATEAAIAAIVSGAQSYQLDTGQSRQLVTKANIASMRLQLQQDITLRDALRARLKGGTFNGRPGW